jgi:Uma2 family endonuclease
MRRTRPTRQTLADLLDRLGNVPLERIRMDPPPGTATEKDVVGRRLCELVHGTLVEKTMGTKEAMLAGYILHLFWAYVDTNDIGLPVGADGAFRLKLGLIRIPDVAFISWARLPEGELPPESIASRVPELAVEVLSSSNTVKEIALKLDEYFHCGVKLVWIIDPQTQTAEEYTARTKHKRLTKSQALDGRDVLRGFRLPLKKLFARVKRGKSR